MSAKREPIQLIEVGPAKPREPLVVSTVWICKRCRVTYGVPCSSPSIFVREATERGGMALLRVHDCADAPNVGVASLIGSGGELPEEPCPS